MDRPTVDVYERSAGAYAAARRIGDPSRARAFAAALPAGALRMDLGCGPGYQLGELGTPIVAADAAAAMLGQVGGRCPGALRVQCDLEALPVRRHALSGVWASKCLQHVPAERLPMALADLHRCLALGGRLELVVFVGDGTTISDDEFPGRLFAGWHPQDLSDVVAGAGFDIDALATSPSSSMEHPLIEVTATRARTLADTVGPAMRLVCCGLNPSVYAADAGIGFARPGNRFWPSLRAAGLTTIDRDPRRLLRDDAIGMTDLVKRATPGADELSPAEYRAGLARVERLCERLRPSAVCMIGLAGWRAATDRRAVVGWQPRPLAATPVYVMPSTSGRNARIPPSELAAHLAMAAAGP